MMGLFNAPAVILAPDCASTPVMSPVAVGHRLDFTSRVTCWEASAIKRATEICGLSLIASASACFRVSDAGIPGVTWGAEDGTFAIELAVFCVTAVCGDGAGGRLCAASAAFVDSWVSPKDGKATAEIKNSRNVTG